MKEPNTMNAGDAGATGGPNEQLVARVVLALKTAGLLPDKYAQSIEQKLRSGKAKESDWRLWAEETVLTKEKSDADNRKN